MTALISRLKVSWAHRFTRSFSAPATGLPSAFATVAIALTASLPAFAQAPTLGLPLDCEPMKTCFIQHYMDTAPEAAPQDFRCGHATYKGHNGVDFRILSAAAARQGVPVLAAAAGMVTGTRDGMTDAFPRETEGLRGALDGRECGNGVVIDHGGGWETQYCHMRQGSIRVISGQRVERGTALGDVGFSGLADTAHLHLSVRHGGKPIDPFTTGSPDGSCLRDASAAISLFDAEIQQGFPYRDGYALQAGFAGRAVTWQELEHDHNAGQPAVDNSEALVFFVRLVHLRAGDRVRLTVTGPQGFSVVSTGKELARNQPIHVAFAGKKRTLPRWPAGLYSAEAVVIRDGAEVVKEVREIRLSE